jgi:hypothetical protein
MGMRRLRGVDGGRKLCNGDGLNGFSWRVKGEGLRYRQAIWWSLLGLRPVDFVCTGMMYFVLVGTVV